jgi:hypothetical protein
MLPENSLALSFSLWKADGRISLMSKSEHRAERED